MFQPLQWQYTPPPTIAPSPPLPPPVPAPAAPESRAAKLIVRLEDLGAAAKYLEGVIVARTGDRGIVLDLAADPELAMSLERLYGADPPQSLSVAMYNNLLDAEAGVQRAEIAIAETAAPVHVDPLQKADLQKVNGVFEDALAEDATLESALPLLLRPLKGDRVIYDHLRESLAEYPILQGVQSGDASSSAEVSTGLPADPETGVPLAYVPPAGIPDWQLRDQGSDAANNRMVTALAQSLSLEQGEAASEAPSGDVSPDTDANLNERLDLWSAYYNGVMGLATEADKLYDDLSQFANTYLYRPLAELQRVLQMLAALKLFFHKPKLKQLKSTMAAFILPRLAAEIGKYVLQLDQNANTIAAPVRRLVSSLGRLFGEIQKVGTDVAYLAAQGGLTGMVRDSISGRHTAPKPKRVAALDTIPAGLAKLGATLSWGMMELVKQQNYAEASLFKCLDSKLGGLGDQIEVMQALRSLDALSGIAKGYLENGFGGVGRPSPGLGLSQVQSNVDRFIASKSPDIPRVDPPSPRVQAVFGKLPSR